MKSLTPLASICALAAVGTLLLSNAATAATVVATAQATAEDVPTEAAANAAIASAEQTAESLHAKVCIAVVDSDGQLVAFKRMDGAAPGCIPSSIKKARAAAVYHTPTLAFMERVNHGEPALITLPGMVPLGGGVPVQTSDSRWIGAVGAAGSLNPNEVKIATAGADTLAGK